MAYAAQHTRAGAGFMSMGLWTLWCINKDKCAVSGRVRSTQLQLECGRWAGLFCMSFLCAAFLLARRGCSTHVVARRVWSRQSTPSPFLSRRIECARVFASRREWEWRRLFALLYILRIRSSVCLFCFGAVYVVFYGFKAFVRLATRLTCFACTSLSRLEVPFVHMKTCVCHEIQSRAVKRVHRAVAG